MVCLQISLATLINIKHVVLDFLGIWINRLFHIFKPIAWNHTLYNVLGCDFTRFPHESRRCSYFSPLACNYFSPHLAHTVHFSQFSSPNTEGGILIGYRKKIKLVYELIPDSFWGYRHSIRSLIDCCEISCNYAF